MPPWLRRAAQVASGYCIGSAVTRGQLLQMGQLALPAAAQAPCKLVSSRVRTGLLIAGALAYFLFAAGHGFHGVYPYHGIWERAVTP